MSYLRKGRSVQHVSNPNSLSAVNAPSLIPNTIQIGSKASKLAVIPPKRTASPITQSFTTRSQQLPQGASHPPSLIPNTIDLSGGMLRSALSASAHFIRRRSMLDASLQREHANGLHKPLSQERATSSQIEGAILHGEEDIRDATEQLADINLAIESKELKPVKDKHFPKVKGLRDLKKKKKEDLKKKAQRGLIRGKGMKKVGRQTINVVEWGNKMISPDFLAFDPPQLYLRYIGKSKTKYLDEEITRNLADVILYHVEHKSLPVDVKELNSAECKLLHDVMDNVKVMNTKERKASLLRLIDITKGEIEAGNDNEELPELLKAYIQEAVDMDYLTEDEGNDLLF